MKRNYKKPTIEKVLFSFEHQIVAASIPPGSYWDPYHINECAYNVDNILCQGVNETTPVLSNAIGKCDFKPYSLR